MSGFGMGFGWFIPLLFIGALIYFINANKKEDLSAKDILDKRYANGEISEQEYKAKREALK
jgi:putative membrane protein